MPMPTCCSTKTLPEPSLALQSHQQVTQAAKVSNQQRQHQGGCHRNIWKWAAILSGIRHKEHHLQNKGMERQRKRCNLLKRSNQLASVYNFTPAICVNFDLSPSWKRTRNGCAKFPIQHTFGWPFPSPDNTIIYPRDS